jgi:hypothetical protein
MYAVEKHTVLLNYDWMDFKAYVFAYLMILKGYLTRNGTWSTWK